MLRLTLERDNSALDLHEFATDGQGLEAQPGLTGLGFPPVNIQWLEGAGDGATFRGQRVLARAIDIPIYAKGQTRFQLKTYLDSLALMLAKPCKLRLIDDDDGTSWYANVVRAGGGDYAYGIDTLGDDDVATVITLMAGDPFWTSEQEQVITSASHIVPFLANITNLAISYKIDLRTIELQNTGNATAYPKWVVTGPGTNFYASDRDGHSFKWTGTLAPGETLTVDTKTGAVLDSAGNNRYAEMEPGPQLWHVPPGITTCDASLEDTDIHSKIDCTFAPRSWLVI